jgi:5-oxoprolinase (ATP-hydrolysing) subunit B
MATPVSPTRLLPSGDSAITVEFSRHVDDVANDRVLALDRTLALSPIGGVTETVPTYRSLLVHYDPLQIGFESLSEQLAALAKLPVPPITNTRRWRIPVAYGGEHGVDLEDVAKTLNTTPDDIVARHIAGDYRVAMIGFTPGWSYLSGLEHSLQMPRLQNPRLLTPAGTVSIGGVQTGVQCLAGPSGWHLLGRTPGRTYQLHREPTFLLEPGDRVTFSAVDDKTFAEQDRAAAAGEIIAELLAS